MKTLFGNLIKKIIIKISDEKEPGLEIEEKKTLRGKGKLKDIEDLYLVGFEVMQDKSDYKFCDNCGRTIKYICHLSEDYIVGPDCAETLTLPEEDLKKVDNYVKDTKSKIRTRNNFISKIKEDNPEPAQLQEFLNSVEPLKNKENFKDASNIYFILGWSGRHLTQSKLSSDITELISNYALNLVYKDALNNNFEKLKEAIDKADPKKIRKKGFWYSKDGEPSKFFEENKGELFKDYLKIDIGLKRVTEEEFWKHFEDAQKKGKVIDNKKLWIAPVQKEVEKKQKEEQIKKAVFDLISYTPPEGLFLKSAPEIAKQLKNDSKDLKQAMSRINFYINRSGSNLSNERKKELEKVKDELRKLYN